jgi:hypothetical protein
MRKQKFDISLKKVSETVELVRFVPTIGHAQHLYTDYEATIEARDGESLRTGAIRMLR